MSTSSSAAILDDQRWAAVEARDIAAHGTFLYGVVTTGVFCRPSCPSRRPRRENARFFDTAAQAELSGLRPCKRCQPTGPSIGARRAEVVACACRIIDTAEEPPDLTALAAEVGVSRFHLHRLFKEEQQVSPFHASRPSRTAT